MKEKFILDTKRGLFRTIAALLTVVMTVSFGTVLSYASTNIVVNKDAGAPTAASPALTDDGESFDTKWDFEDFTWQTSIVSDTHPTITEPVWWSSSAYASGVTTATIDGNKVLKSTSNSNLRLLFGKLIKTGTLHTTFYIRKDGDLDVQGGFATGYYGNLASHTAQNNDIGTIIQMQNANFKTKNEGGWTVNGWAQTASSYENDTWHRVDLVVKDNATNGSGVNVFLNGTKINNSTIKTYEFKDKTAVGITGLAFFGWNKAGNFYLDDVRVRRYTGTQGLVLETETPEVVRENPTLAITLTDIVDSSKLIKENIKVTKVSDNSEVTEFTVSDASQTGFTLNFEGTLDYGSYNVVLDQTNIAGITTGDKASTLTFRTPYRNLDGVVYPTIDSAKYFDYDGREDAGNEKTSMLSKIELTFNCLVDEESALSKISVDGVDNEEVEITTVDGVSKATITFPSFLNGNAEYRWVVAEGIYNEAQTLASEAEDARAVAFTTLDDAGFCVLKNEVDAEGYKFKFVKNSNKSYALSAVAAVYEDVTYDGTTYKKLKAVKVIPIEVSAEYKGVVEKMVPGTISGTKTYFMLSYPGFEKVELENGMINE